MPNVNTLLAIVSLHSAVAGLRRATAGLHPSNVNTLRAVADSHRLIASTLPTDAGTFRPITDWLLVDASMLRALSEFAMAKSTCAKRLIFAFNPNRIDRTYLGSASGLPFSILESKRDFKFTVGRTF